MQYFRIFYGQRPLWIFCGIIFYAIFYNILWAAATLNILWYNILRNILEYFTGSGYIQYFDVRYPVLMLRMKWIIGVNQTKCNISGQHWGRRHKNLCRHWQWRPCKHTHFFPFNSTIWSDFFLSSHFLGRPTNGWDHNCLHQLSETQWAKISGLKKSFNFINKSNNKLQINFRLWVEVVDKVGVEVMGQGRAGKTGQLGRVFLYLVDATFLPVDLSKLSIHIYSDGELPWNWKSLTSPTFTWAKVLSSCFA